MADIHTAVHTGVWTNWSVGQVLGKTLTIPQSQGYLLVVFLGLFVKFAGDQLWQILRFVLHQQRSSEKPQDGLHYQTQAILRNSSIGIGTAWKFAQMIRAWSRKSYQAPRRTLPYIAYTLFHITALGMAGLFSSRAVSMPNAVLVRSPFCGWMAEPAKNKYDLLLSWSDKVQAEIYVSLYSTLHRTIKSSAEYARACSDDTSFANAICQQYISSRLEPKINFTAACPFTKELCLGDAIHIDTGYLDSHEDLGINSQPSDRIQLRKQMTCAPIDVEGRLSVNRTTIPDSPVPSDTYRGYFFGSKRVSTPPVPDNVTMFISNYSIFYQSSPYVLRTGNILSTFWAISGLRQLNGDHTALELMSEASYIQKTEDLWYSATAQEDFFWRTDHPVSVLVCTEQYSYCNMSYCTDNSGFYELMSIPGHSGLVTMNNAQWITLELVWKAAQASNLYFLASFLGSEILLAQDLLMSSQLFVAPGLPSDQWKQEIKNMHATSMAILQRRVVEFASPPNWALGPGQRTTDFLVKPNTTFAQALCQNIKIRAPGVASFSVIGIISVLGTGVLLTMLNFFFTDIVFWFYRRKTGVLLGFREREWRGAELLQIQRRMFEEQGITSWEGCNDDVPVTQESGQKFREQRGNRMYAAGCEFEERSQFTV
ncbi:hypothetical protein F5882DRAFT_495263 [Hyaloscypha sp. PMI_1271]|nr:hypothetical protein F5882DRAFT_495263 [Hyaloscypha sp. PMI_1271]